MVVFGEAIGDDDTVAQAATPAKRNIARLTINAVIAEDIRPIAIAEKGKLLHRLATSFGQLGVTIDTVVSRGTLILEIIRQVPGEKYDLVRTAAEQGRNTVVCSLAALPSTSCEMPLLSLGD